MACRTQGSHEDAIAALDRNADVGTNAQRPCRFAVSPALGDVRGIGSSFGQGPFAQGVVPFHFKSLGNLHRCGIAGKLDPLNTFVEVNGGQISRVHARNCRQDFQQGTCQLLDGLCAGNRNGELFKEGVHDRAGSFAMAQTGPGLKGWAAFLLSDASGENGDKADFSFNGR